MTAPTGNPGPNRDHLEYRLRSMQGRVDSLEQRGLRNAGEISVYAPNGVKTFSVGPDLSVPPVTGAPWYAEIRDKNDGIVLSSDRQGGIALPWIPIVMYPRFAVAAGLFDYMSRAVDTTERVLWEGWMGYVSHPRTEFIVVCGAASGTNTTRYKYKVNNQVVGQWDVSAGASAAGRGPFDHTTVAPLHSYYAHCELTAQTLSGTGSYACQITSLHQRQS